MVTLHGIALIAELIAAAWLAIALAGFAKLPRGALAESRPRKSAQDDKWSFCLTAGTLWPANQERP